MTPRPRFDRATVDAVAWRIYREGTAAMRRRPEYANRTFPERWADVEPYNRSTSRAVARFVLAHGFVLPKPRRVKGCDRG